MPKLRRLQAELSARHSYREAARLLTILLPCQLMNHATVRDRTHRIAAELEQIPIGFCSIRAHDRSGGRLVTDVG